MTSNQVAEIKLKVMQHIRTSPNLRGENIAVLEYVMELTLKEVEHETNVGGQG